MTSDGSPLTRLRLALRAGDLLRVRATAAELPYIPLSDALAILELIEVRDEGRFEPAAVRWAGRLALEAPGLTLAQLQLAIKALDGLPDGEARATSSGSASSASIARCSCASVSPGASSASRPAQRTAAGSKHCSSRASISSRMASASPSGM
jgi:hypothetical protein